MTINSKIIALISSALLAVLAQILLKKGMMIVGETSAYPSLFSFMVRAFLQYYVLAGLFLYFLSAAAWLAVLSAIQLNVAFSLNSISFVIVPVLSWLILKEPVTAPLIIGNLFIIAGIFTIAKGLH